LLRGRRNRLWPAGSGGGRCGAGPLGRGSRRPIWLEPLSCL